MYHKVTNQKGKEWSYYICSGRYTKKTDCRQPILGARGSEYSADGLIAWMVADKFSEPDFIEARIEESLAAANTTEARLRLAAANKAVKDLEGQKSSYEEAIGGTKNASVIASLVKRLEDLD